MSSRRLVSAATFVVFGLAARSAAAQASGFAIDHFNTSERGSDWFGEDSLDLRGGLRGAAGIVGEYADRPLVIVGQSGSTVAAPVQDQFIIHPGGSLILANRVRFAFDLPLAVYEDGTAGNVGTESYAATSAGGLGDLRVSGDVRVVGTYGDPFTMAIGLAMFLPTGSQGAYLSDGSVRALGRVAFAGSASMFTYAAHLGFEVRSDQNVFPGYPTGSEAQVGGSAGLRLLEKKLVVGPEVYASTVVTSSSAVFSTRQTPVEGLLGTHYTFASDWRAGLGVGTGLTRGFGEPAVRLTFGIEWAPAYVPLIVDRDKDTVPDRSDACPDVPGVPSDDPKTNGCPPPDRDHDGVPDAVDACPDVAGVKTDDPKTNGCPPDRDHDGVPDSEDMCIDTPGVHMDNKATNGCPPDSDKDGIPDAEDACPDVPGIRTTDPKTNGCPDLDRDKDEIPNAEDACPDVKGPRNGDPKRNGCPEAYVSDDQIKLLDALKFGKRDELLVKDPETKTALDSLLVLLGQHPEIKHVRIEGHTDNQGDPALKRGISAKRAAALQTWLVRQGVAPARLTIMGVGGDSPIQDNTTDEGRKANERIELHVEP
jgi:outer membrane protein OmpA-like peptidoglycan-associated protein